MINSKIKFIFLIFFFYTVNVFSNDFIINKYNVSEDGKEKKEKKLIDDGTGASQKGNMMIQVSLNVAHHLGFKTNYSSFGYNDTYKGIIPGLTINLDYNVHRYVGVGLYYSVGFHNYTKSNVFYLGNAFGARSTFHWWQLLDDKSDADLFSDKIDFDIHANIGGYLLSEKNKNNNTKIKRYGVNAGAGIGIKYYFVKNFGVAIDAGFEEASYAKLGFVIKI